jgi:outer membrane lipoprotein-sorting protein
MFFAGCAAPKVVPYAPRPPLSPEYLVEKVRSGSQKVKSLSGFGKFRLQDGENNHSGSVAISLRKEAFLRLEVLNLFSQPIQLFQADGERLLSYNPKEKSAVMGKPDAESVYRLVGIRMGVDKLVSFLLGEAEIDSDSKKNVVYENESDRYRLRMGGEDTVLSELWVVPDTFRPARYCSYDERGDIRLRIKWENFHSDKDIPFATEIFIELSQEKTTLKMRYTDFDLNTGVFPPKFKLPQGTKLRILKP